jgi:environmental stress-induced protein Ves
MKWKNGKGETLQIAIFPREARFPADPFVWRLSSATINEGGPFSEFRGYRRAITLLRGRGLGIQMRSGREELITQDSIFIFSGDETVNGILHDGSVIDLNLIWDDGKTNCTLKAIRFADLESNQALAISTDSRTHTLLFYFVKSGAQIDGGDPISENETCIVENRGPIQLKISFKGLEDQEPSTILFYAIGFTNPI